MARRGHLAFVVRLTASAKRSRSLAAWTGASVILSVRHAPCNPRSVGDEQKLIGIRSQLSDTLVELRTISQRLREFDHTVAAVNLRAELSRLRRHLDTLSDTVTIVVEHLLSVTKAKQP